jgi:hypothetical protein
VDCAPAPRLSPGREFGAKRTRSAPENGRGAAWLARSSGTEANDYCQGTIDLAKLTKRKQSVGFAEPARIDGTELLDQDPSPLTVDFHFRPGDQPRD